GIGHIFNFGACNCGGNISLACHPSGADVRQPFLGAIAFKFMRDLRRLTLRSRSLLIWAAIVLAMLTAIVWSIPIPAELQKSPTGRDRRSWSRKLYEAILAWKLEHRWSKERILAEYLNRSSYGNRRIGPEAAARAYFGKSARDLTLSEAIFLAGLPQAPTRLNPWRHPEEAGRKYARSLARLVQLGFIDRDQELLLAQPPKAEHADPSRLAPHFVDA